MKKTLLVIVALVMALALVIGSVSTVSANGPTGTHKRSFTAVITDTQNVTDIPGVPPYTEVSWQFDWSNYKGANNISYSVYDNTNNQYIVPEGSMISVDGSSGSITGYNSDGSIGASFTITATLEGGSHHLRTLATATDTYPSP